MDWFLASLVALFFGYRLGRYAKKPRKSEAESKPEPQPNTEDAREEPATTERQQTSDTDLLGIANSLSFSPTDHQGLEKVYYTRIYNGKLNLSTE